MLKGLEEGIFRVSKTPFIKLQSHDPIKTFVLVQTINSCLRKLCLDGQLKRKRMTGVCGSSSSVCIFSIICNDFESVILKTYTDPV